MKLQNIDFGVVLGQSGVQGFFGEGDEYPHHKLLRYMPGYSLEGMTFVAKTTSVGPRIYPTSNTILAEDYKLKELLPSSIWVTPRSFFGGYMLNAMGIPTPGLRILLRKKKWQKRTEPFQLSYLPEGKTLEDKIEDVHAFVDLVADYLPPSVYKYGIQVNISCPNTAEGKENWDKESIAILTTLRARLPGVPLIVKYDLLVEPKTVSDMKEYCDAFCIGNTMAFGEAPTAIEWGKLFDNSISPLTKHFSGKFKGGLSGKPLFPLLVDWLARMQSYDPDVKIIAGGGIMTKSDIDTLAGFHIVHAVALGSVATLRPWRMKSLITHANKIIIKRK